MIIMVIAWVPVLDVNCRLPWWVVSDFPRPRS